MTRSVVVDADVKITATVADALLAGVKLRNGYQIDWDDLRGWTVYDAGCEEVYSYLDSALAAAKIASLGFEDEDEVDWELVKEANDLSEVSVATLCRWGVPISLRVELS